MGEYFGATIGKYDATTGAAVNASLITGFFTPIGLAFDATGTLFVSSLGNQGVQSFNATTGSAVSGERLGGISNTFGIAFDESNRFFVSRYSSSSSFVAKFTTTGTTVANPLINFSPDGPTSLVYVVPEPSTYAMTLAALACGGWMLRRRSRLADRVGFRWAESGARKSRERLR